MKKKLPLIPVILFSLLFLFSCVSTPHRQDFYGQDEEESVIQGASPDRTDETPDIAAAETAVPVSARPSEPAEQGKISDRDCEKAGGRDLFNALGGKNIILQGVSYYPVYAGFELTYSSADFFLDPCLEYAVIYAEGLLPEDAGKDKVSSIRNIFEKEENLKKYLLAVYSYESGRFEPVKKIALEGRGAFISVETLLVDRNTGVRAVVVTFNTLEGNYEEIIIFNRSGNHAVTGIRNTLSSSTRKEDIDNNGIIDILRYEQIFVEGTGAETFITWLRLDGINYRPVRTINIVGSLKEFFASSRSLLENKNVKGFVEKAAAVPVLRQLKNLGITDADILHRIFYPARKENSAKDADINNLIAESKSLNVVFPDLFENPFRPDREGLYSFTTYVRINYTASSADADNEALYLVKIYMLPNPFNSQRFAFFVN